MFTVCPKCALTLVVTAADLRVAQGYVRCGRCLNVFNALARLSEERPATAPTPETTAVEGPAPAEGPMSTEGPMSAEEPAPDAEPVFADEQVSVSAEGPLSVEETGPVEESAFTGEEAPAENLAPDERREDDTSQQPIAPTFAENDDTGEIEFELDPSILVTSVRAPTALEETGELEMQEGGLPPGTPPPPAIAPSEPAALPPEPPPAAPAHAGAAPANAAAAPHTASIHAAPAHAEVDPVQGVTAVAASIKGAREDRATDTPGPIAQFARNATSVSPNAEPQTNTVHEGADAAIELVAQRPRAGIAWKLGAGALAILLLLQIVNHYRDALASDSGIGKPLASLYSALGVKLAPRWNIHAYDVRQLGASAAGAATGQIVVRASVKNTASRAQPLPLLRVTLQDRFGNRIAARDVPPSNYLPSSVARASLLAAGSRVDATMIFVDPGPQAVGFEIDACLRRQRGEVACAHGP